MHGCCCLLHSAITPLGPFAASHPAGRVINFLGAARHWTCLWWSMGQTGDARGRMTGWVCAILQHVAGCGDGRENECTGEEHPPQLNWQCLADTQPHHSKTLLEINRGEMY